MSPKEQATSIGEQESHRRRPSWIQKQSITTAVDPSAWPPHNPELEYDWSRPTHEFYKDSLASDYYRSNDGDDKKQKKQKQPFNLAPAFATARQRLDYSYHNCLIITRQRLQDAILGRVVQSPADVEEAEDDDESKQPEKFPCPQKRPWIVFTAGPMGVGKGYVLTQLNQKASCAWTNSSKLTPTC